MDDYPNTPADERAILDLLDAAEVGNSRRLLDTAHKILDLQDRAIAQQAALKVIHADPTAGAEAPQETT